MNQQDYYKAWIKQKQNISPSPNFTKQTMLKIITYSQARRKPSFDGPRLAERLSARPFSRAALLAAGVMIALVKIIFTVNFALG